MKKFFKLKENQKLAKNLWIILKSHNYLKWVQKIMEFICIFSTINSKSHHHPSCHSQVIPYIFSGPRI